MLRTITFTEVIDLGQQAATTQGARILALPTTSFNNGFQEFEGMLGLTFVSKTATQTGPSQVTITIIYTYDLVLDPEQRWPDDTSLGYATAELFGDMYRGLIPAHVIEVRTIT